MLVGKWNCKSTHESELTFGIEIETDLNLEAGSEFQLYQFYRCRHNIGETELYSFRVVRKGNWKRNAQTLTLEDISIDADRISSVEQLADTEDMKRELLRDQRLETRQYIVSSHDDKTLVLEPKDTEASPLRLSRIA